MGFEKQEVEAHNFGLIGVIRISSHSGISLGRNFVVAFAGGGEDMEQLLSFLSDLISSMRSTALLFLLKPCSAPHGLIQFQEIVIASYEVKECLVSVRLLPTEFDSAPQL